MLANGNVGIGTTSPQSIFHIGASAPANAGVKPYTGLSASYEGFLFDYYYDTSANNVRVFDIAALGFAVSGLGGSEMRFLTVPQTTTNTPLERMRITSGGDVGIGTTSPSTILHLSTAEDAFLRIATTAASGKGSILQYYANGTENAYAGVPFNSYNTYVIGVNGSERMRITSGGNVLIGTTTDAGQKLQVSGDIYSTGDYTINQAAQQSIIFQTSGTSKWNLANNVASSYFQIFN